MFANLLGHQSYFSEMNVLDDQWMSRVTGHQFHFVRPSIALIRGITDAIELADRMMRKAGIARPRIAVAALNPHAGEDGLFGRDEIEMIRPTVEAVAKTGIACSGPFPADTIYIRAFAGEFDSVVAMYHDQGQIATKLRSGFNLAASQRRPGLRPSLRHRRTVPRSISSARALRRPVRSRARSASLPNWRQRGQSSA